MFICLFVCCELVHLLIRRCLTNKDHLDHLMVLINTIIMTLWFFVFDYLKEKEKTETQKSEDEDNDKT